MRLNIHHTPPTAHKIRLQLLPPLFFRGGQGPSLPLRMTCYNSPLSLTLSHKGRGNNLFTPTPRSVGVNQHNPWLAATFTPAPCLDRLALNRYAGAFTLCSPVAPAEDPAGRLSCTKLKALGSIMPSPAEDPAKRVGKTT